MVYRPHRAHGAGHMTRVYKPVGQGGKEAQLPWGRTQGPRIQAQNLLRMTLPLPWTHLVLQIKTKMVALSHIGGLRLKGGGSLWYEEPTHWVPNLKGFGGSERGIFRPPTSPPFWNIFWNPLKLLVELFLKFSELSLPPGARLQGEWLSVTESLG